MAYTVELTWNSFHESANFPTPRILQSYKNLLLRCNEVPQTAWDITVMCRGAVLPSDQQHSAPHPPELQGHTSSVQAPVPSGHCSWHSWLYVLFRYTLDMLDLGKIPGTILLCAQQHLVCVQQPHNQRFPLEVVSWILPSWISRIGASDNHMWLSVFFQL